MQVTYFLIGPMFTLLLCYHFVLYREKVTSYEKIRHKSKLYGKFQRFSAIDGTIELLKMVEYPKMPTKMKICKTFYEGHTTNHRSGNHSAPPNEIKSYHVSGTKIFSQRYGEKYRHLLSKYFKNSVLGPQEMMQCKCFF